jgi:hypothetical protein
MIFVAMIYRPAVGGGAAIVSGAAAGATTAAAGLTTASGMASALVLDCSHRSLVRTGIWLRSPSGLDTAHW